MPGTITGWGDHSTSGSAAAEDFHLGVRLTDCLIKGTSDAYPGFEAPDLLNSKLVVLWGFDPMVSWFGMVPYYMKLAQERGCKFILIDPVYNVSAEVLGAQWIPIRPGTDTAFGLAVAHVLYTEDLYDHDYVAKWVEPEGFESGASTSLATSTASYTIPSGPSPSPASPPRPFASSRATTRK